MNIGIKYNPGDVVLIAVEGINNKKVSKRPAFILYANHDSLIACGVSRSKLYDGVSLTSKDRATTNCKVFLKYMFTISPEIVLKKLFSVSSSKKKEVYKKLKQKIQLLK